MASDYPFVELNFREIPQPDMLRRSREFYEEMNRRRSVRAYSDREVPGEIVENAILTAGRRLPARTNNRGPS